MVKQIVGVLCAVWMVAGCSDEVAPASPDGPPMDAGRDGKIRKDKKAPRPDDGVDRGPRPDGPGKPDRSVGPDQWIKPDAAPPAKAMLRGYGSSQGVGFNGMAMDGKGNMFVGGWLRGSITVAGKTLTSKGNNDVLLLKLDPTGKALWGVTGGGSKWDGVDQVALDGAGNVYITGYYQYFATIGGKQLTGQYNRYDLFVAKLSPAGKFLWLQAAGGDKDDAAPGLVVDKAGNAFIAGTMAGTVKFGNKTLTSTNAYGDPFAARLDPKGSWGWVVTAKTGGAATGLAADGKGALLLAGHYLGAANLGGHKLTSKGSYDVLAARLTPGGSVTWATSFGGAKSDKAGGIAADTKGNACLTGGFEGAASFDSVKLTPAGQGDLFAARINASGKVQWALAAGGPNNFNNDNGVAVVVDSAGTCHVTGKFVGEATVGKTKLVSPGGKWDTAFLLASVSPAGKFTRALMGTASSYDHANAVQVDSARNVYVAGTSCCGTLTAGTLSLKTNGKNTGFIWRTPPTKAP